MSTLRTIYHRNPHTASVVGFPGNLGHDASLDALAAAGVVSPQDITFQSLYAKGFGDIGMQHLAVALAQEVCRLQAIVDAVHAALDAKPCAN